MNQNKRVVLFTFFTIISLLSISIITELYGNKLAAFKNVSLLADVIVKERKEAKKQELNKTKVTSNKENLAVYEDYTHPNTILLFNQDKELPALAALMQKLANLKAGTPKKIRIAWFGDSLIEADLLTQTFRKRMQEFFGGSGVGFVPCSSVSANIRQSVLCKTTGEWNDENFKDNALNHPIHFCGHVFTTTNGILELKDKSISNLEIPLEKSLICGQEQGNIAIHVNGKPFFFSADNYVNRVVLDSSNAPSINVSINNNALPLYGISVESKQGVIVDNFSFRGITGTELRKLDSSFLKSMQQNNAYDLIVLEYGTNLLYLPQNKNYSYYYRKMKPVLAFLKKEMPNTEFLLISSSDRAFKYDEYWETAIGMDSLIAVQARLAYENKMAFYNMYESMGGEGTIVRWADSSESYANKDYIHPNHKGAAFLGNLLFDAFIKDYDKLNTFNKTTSSKSTLN